MDVKRTSTYTLEVSSAEMATLVLFAHAAEQLCKATVSGGQVQQYMGDSADPVVEQLQDLDSHVVGRVQQVLFDYGLELGID